MSDSELHALCKTYKVRPFFESASLSDRFQASLTSVCFFSFSPHGNTSSLPPPSSTVEKSTLFGRSSTTVSPVGSGYFFSRWSVSTFSLPLNDAFHFSSSSSSLPFPQFTQILDILKTVLDHLGVKWVILTGMTKVDERQSLVDEFTNDSEIKVFLLSTLAGGMGINLTAASVVVV